MTLRKIESTKKRLFRHSLLKTCSLMLLPLILIVIFSTTLSIRDSSKAIHQNMRLTLESMDSTFSTIFSHVDNASYFFSSNPRVTIQLDNAFQEESISLKSLQSTRNISLYFQNLLYTNTYFENIYVYYTNPHHRIFIPAASNLQAITDSDENAILSILENAPGRNTWMLPSSRLLAHADTPTQTLYIFRNLYHLTSSPKGLLVFQCKLDAINDSFQNLMQMQEQSYYIFDTDSTLICSNNPDSSIIADLQSHLAEYAQSNTFSNIHASLAGKHYLLNSYQEERVDGLIFFTLVPLTIAYQSAFNMAQIYILLSIISVILAIFLAYIKTNREYRYLNVMFDLFQNPAQAQNINTAVSPLIDVDPLEYITYNLTRLFLEQNYLKIQSAEQESRMKLLELQTLQYQINPHFMLNTLNAIYWEAVNLTTSENACSDMVHNLSSLMRYSLSAPHEDVTIEQEIHYIQVYSEIMRHRFPDKYQVYYHIEESCKHFPIRKMLLQPLMENAIYHGMKEKSTPGEIHVGVRQLHNHIAVYIYDNGTGIAPKTVAMLKKQMKESLRLSSEKVGILNTNFRLVYSYGPTAALHIQSVQNRYTGFYFFLPLELSSN